jgi:hypothetical protein
VYASAPPAQRRQTHRRIARLTEDLKERVGHLAVGAAGRDALRLLGEICYHDHLLYPGELQRSVRILEPERKRVFEQLRGHVAIGQPRSGQPRHSQFGGCHFDACRASYSTVQLDAGALCPNARAQGFEDLEGALEEIPGRALSAPAAFDLSGYQERPR